jgi:hypothetical protein
MGRFDCTPNCKNFYNKLKLTLQIVHFLEEKFHVHNENFAYKYFKKKTLPTISTDSKLGDTQSIVT